MNILHYRRTPLAWAPDALSGALNRYTEHRSEILTDPAALPTGRAARETLVHFHNQYVPYPGPKCIQYHSEPDNPGLMLPQDHADDPNLPAYRLVVAQYHATLPEYADCHPVRNVLDWRLPEYAENPVGEFRVAYSPSVTRRVRTWYDKGYEQTVAILEAVQSRHADMSYDVITGVPLAECLARKAACSVVIDEHATGSYHRSGLEGLALGKITLAWINPAVMQVLQRAAGCQVVPFCNVPISQLEDRIEKILTNTTPEERIVWGHHNRLWMEYFWKPETIAQEYVQHYQRVWEQHHADSSLSS